MRFILMLPFLALHFCGTAQKPLLPRDSSARGPQTFAIIVGISKYKFVRPLTYADKDAELFRDYLRSPGGGNVSDNNIFCLLNEQANNLNFWGKGFQWLKAKNLQRGDKLFIYLAGHGDAIDEDQFFFLGYDCNPGGDKNNYLVSGAIQLFNLKKKIANETARGVEVVFIMDACRSDELPGGTAGQNFLNSAVTEKKAGEIIMLATGAGQESLEDESIGNGHGLFTYYLIDGLVGAADSANRDLEVTFSEIESYVNNYVPAIAQQRFRRRQEPFFCCNENSEKVIGRVNTAYYQLWRSRHRGPGNSFHGVAENKPAYSADTLLQETYNRFNTAVRNNRLSDAENYLRMLQVKFPGSGHTLDARSTLAVEYAAVAQKLVDDFIVCNISPRNKRSNYDVAATNLEKAIGYFRSDEPDFANSLLGRLYLLRALGNTQPMENARAALAFDPNGAYAHYAVSLIHMENQQYDSAVHYAQKSVDIAPAWPCAVSLLSLARERQQNPDQPKPKNLMKPRFGVMLAGGASEPNVEVEPDRDPTILEIGPGMKAVFEAGLHADIPISTRFSFRPVIQVSFVNGDIVYERQPQTGGPVITEMIPFRYTAINLPLGFVFRFGDERIRPYLALAPVASYAMHEGISAEQFKKFNLLGEISAGVDIRPIKGTVRFSPELRYNRAITDQHEPGSLNAVNAVRKHSFLFTVYIGKD